MYTSTTDDPFNDGPSPEEQAEAAARWLPCEGGWEQYTPHPFDPTRTVRLFMPRLFTAEPLPSGPMPAENPPGGDGVPGDNGDKRALAYGKLTPCHDLHMLAQTDPAQFRARLAALSDADLEIQAKLYALYASVLCSREISQTETLRHFRLAAQVHHATQRSEDHVCCVLYELALTDGPALIEFLRGHTDQQRTQLAWRFTAWLKREHDIVRKPLQILKGWHTLIVGASASGAEQLRIELANHLGYVEGWDAVIAMLAEAQCPACGGEGRIPASGCGDQAGGWAETCQECQGTGAA